VPLDVFEFASGYGCVSRHLNVMSKKYKICACDIHPQAVDFLRDKLGVDSILSERIPERLSLDRKFPIVFALSFFSHMPDATWGRWMAKLTSLLSDGGILVFTTHGAKTARNLLPGIVVSEDGYWFSPTSEQKDLSTEEYGTTVVMPKYVLSGIERSRGAHMIFFQEGLWWGHQDAYIVQKRDT
jgi:hypothetical protein